MHPLVTRVYASKFARSVAIVATGTAAAQAINMAFMPLLTRFYSPEAFGLLGTFVSLLAMVSPLVALSYPIALVLPRHDVDAKGLARLSLRISVGISLLALVVIFLFQPQIVTKLQLESVANFLYLLPLAMFFAGCLAIAQQWVIRKKLFKLKARVAVYQALWLSLAKSGAGLINPLASVLIVLGAFASGLHAFLLLLALRKHKRVVDAKDGDDDDPADGAAADAVAQAQPLKTLAREHIDFPLYRTPQVFLNSVSQSLPILMLAAFFGPASAGFYALSKTVLALPITLVGGAIASVFYPHINEAVLAGKRPHRMMLKATLAIAGIGGFPFLIIGIFGPQLFAFIFGAEWSMAGEYARWLSLWYFFGFINRPSVGAIAVLRLQKLFLGYEIVSVVARVAALYVGFVLFEDDLVAVAMFSIVSAALNFLLVTFTLSYAKRFKL